MLQTRRTCLYCERNKHNRLVVDVKQYSLVCALKFDQCPRKLVQCGSQKWSKSDTDGCGADIESRFLEEKAQKQVEEERNDAL